MKATVYVTLKNGVLDPQGEAVAQALGALGFDRVREVRVSKMIELEIDAETPAAARETIERMCEKLLANTVIENYRIDIP